MVQNLFDHMLPRTGGPAGNAALTAWTGLTLLVLSVAELLTLFNVTGLISWHVANVVLGADFRDHDCDLKRLIVTIAATRAFQLESAHPWSTDRPPIP